MMKRIVKVTTTGGICVNRPVENCTGYPVAALLDMVQPNGGPQLLVEEVNVVGSRSSQ